MFVPQAAHLFLLQAAAHPTVGLLPYCRICSPVPIPVWALVLRFSGALPDPGQLCANGSKAGARSVDSGAPSTAALLAGPRAPTRQPGRAQTGKAVPREAALCIALHLCAVVCLKIQR